MAAEKKLELALAKKEENAMRSLDARIAMAEKSAKVLEEKIVGLEARINELTKVAQERQSILNDVMQRTEEFYASLPTHTHERKTG